MIKKLFVALLLITTIVMSQMTGVNFTSASQKAEIVAGSDIQTVPLTMQPDTILKYDENLNTTILFQLEDSQQSSKLPKINLDAETKFIDKEALAAEEAYVQEIKESAKDLPIIDLGFYLPSPSPGLVVIYGSDGHINRFYNELEIANAANAADAGINAVITV